MKKNAVAANNTVVAVNGLHKSFHGNVVLKGIDLHVAPQELTVLIGPSGCGKSTFLRCINCLEIFDQGKITIGEISLERAAAHAPLDNQFHAKARQLRLNVGMVFQSFNLFPHMTVLQNIMKAPMVVKGMAEKQAEATAREFIEVDHADALRTGRKPIVRFFIPAKYRWDAIRNHPAGFQIVLLDCLTLLANNIIVQLPEPIATEEAERALNAEIDELLAAYAASEAEWIIVSNEVGLGLVPPYPLGRVYRDALGKANQRVAAAADEVLFMVAGLPLKIK